jgi:hypothetical protein
MLQIARLKRRKLALKDEIVRLEDQLMPDIIASHPPSFDAWPRTQIEVQGIGHDTWRWLGRAEGAMTLRLDPSRRPGEIGELERPPTVGQSLDHAAWASSRRGDRQAPSRAGRRPQPGSIARQQQLLAVRAPSTLGLGSVRSPVMPAS